jgi:putative hydrolase of the HAD superfamily
MPLTCQVATSLSSFKALIFDIYGTLLDAPRGGIRPDPAADPLLLGILQNGNWRRGIKITLPGNVIESPSTALYYAVKSHHDHSPHLHPEVDLRKLWAELLDLPYSIDPGQLVIELHSAWNPVTWIDGSREALYRASRHDRVLGLLSNAQYDTVEAIRPFSAYFQPDLVLLSFQQGVAKPSPELFVKMAARLEARGIRPDEVLYVGNDPAHDIIPARQVGFHPMLFQRQPDAPHLSSISPQKILSDWWDFLPAP